MGRSLCQAQSQASVVRDGAGPGQAVSWLREFIPPLPGGHRNADGNGEASLLSSLKDGTISTSEEPKMEPTSQDPAWRARRGHDDQEGGHG